MDEYAFGLVLGRRVCSCERSPRHRRRARAASTARGRGWTGSGSRTSTSSRCSARDLSARYRETLFCLLPFGVRKMIGFAVTVGFLWVESCGIILITSRNMFQGSTKFKVVHIRLIMGPFLWWRQSNHDEWRSENVGVTWNFTSIQLVNMCTNVANLMEGPLVGIVSTLQSIPETRLAFDL